MSLPPYFDVTVRSKPQKYGVDMLYTKHDTLLSAYIVDVKVLENKF